MDCCLYKKVLLDGLSGRFRDAADGCFCYGQAGVVPCRFYSFIISSIIWFKFKPDSGLSRLYLVGHLIDIRTFKGGITDAVTVKGFITTK